MRSSVASKVIKLCDAFNCKLSDLIEYTPEKKDLV
ncbi:helix-turn-helix domain-containing protein [Paenibacillus sp. 481]|nr:helix-turn-helix domain-containing protein [Paenibacillus sp. 481]